MTMLRFCPHHGMHPPDKLLFQSLEWDWVARAEDYVRTGDPLELHSMTGDEQWAPINRIYEITWSSGGSTVGTASITRSC